MLTTKRKTTTAELPKQQPSATSPQAQHCVQYCSASSFASPRSDKHSPQELTMPLPTSCFLKALQGHVPGMASCTSSPSRQSSCHRPQFWCQRQPGLGCRSTTLWIRDESKQNCRAAWRDTRRDTVARCASFALWCSGSGQAPLQRGPSELVVDPPNQARGQFLT